MAAPALDPRVVEISKAIAKMPFMAECAWSAEDGSEAAAPTVA